MLSENKWNRLLCGVGRVCRIVLLKTDSRIQVKVQKHIQTGCCRLELDWDQEVTQTISGGYTRYYRRRTRYKQEKGNTQITHQTKS